MLTQQLHNPDCRSSSLARAGNYSKLGNEQAGFTEAGARRCTRKTGLYRPGRPRFSSVLRMKIGTTAPFSSGTATPDWMKPRRRGRWVERVSMGGPHGAATLPPAGLSSSRVPGGRYSIHFAICIGNRGERVDPGFGKRRNARSTLLIRSPILVLIGHLCSERYVVRCRSKNGHEEEVCFKRNWTTCLDCGNHSRAHWGLKSRHP